MLLIGERTTAVTIVEVAHLTRPQAKEALPHRYKWCCLAIRLETLRVGLDVVPVVELLE
jgi:hypothetical protein